eukprot:Skav230151  [mRNA]  locus=scaffold1301:415689:421240:- [translate_table: standard]
MKRALVTSREAAGQFLPKPEANCDRKSEQLSYLTFCFAGHQLGRADKARCSDTGVQLERSQKPWEGKRYGDLDTELASRLRWINKMVSALVPGAPGMVVPPGGSPVAAMARAAAGMQALAMASAKWEAIGRRLAWKELLWHQRRNSPWTVRAIAPTEAKAPMAPGPCAVAKTPAPTPAPPLDMKVIALFVSKQLGSQRDPPVSVAKEMHPIEGQASSSETQRTKDLGLWLRGSEKVCDMDEDCIAVAEEADVIITGGTSHFAVCKAYREAQHQLCDCLAPEAAAASAESRLTDFYASYAPERRRRW